MKQFALVIFCWLSFFDAAYGLDLLPSGVKFDHSIRWHEATLETDQIDIILKLPEHRWQLPNDKDMTLGFVDSVFWAKVPLTVLTPGTWILKTNIATLNKLETWVIDEDQFIYPLSGTVGIDIPATEYASYRLPDITQNLRFPSSGDYTLLFRLEQNGFLDFPAELLPTHTVLNDEVQGSFSLGIYNGLFLTVLIISLVYFVITVDFSFLAFSFIVSGFMLFFGYVDGILSWWIWPGVPVLNTWIKLISLPLLNIGIAWYGITFFKLPEKLDWLRKALHINLLAALLLLCATPFISFKILVYCSLTLALTTITTSLIKGTILAIQHKNRIAIPFTLAWAIFGSYAVIVLLSIFNLIPITTNNLVHNLKFFFCAMVIFLFAALAMRKRKIETEMIRANEQNKAKSNLMARVSHEIRTPINGILGLSQLLEDHLNDDKEARQYQQLIVESTESLLHIVDDLMNARQFEEGKVQLVLSEVQLPRIVESCANLLRAQIEGKNLSLIVSISENAYISAYLDETRVRQIITNLVNNAFKFTQQGSIKVELNYHEVDQLFVLKVIDTGIGIKEDQLENILLPFEQAANSKYQVYEGIGLGLFITKSLIDLMGGTLKISSKESVGSTFEVSLPANSTPND